MNIRVDASRFAPGHSGKWHSCASAQLIYPTGGVMSLQTARGMWTVPPQRACWLPGNEPHRVETRCGFQMLSVYTSAEARGKYSADSGIVAVSDILRASIFALANPRDRSAERNRHIMKVVTDELSMELLPDFAVTPIKDGPLSAIIRAWENDPADPRTLYDWASTLGVSPRTLTRAFRRTTQLTFREYRAHLRVQFAIAQLASGASVTSVAYCLGYTSVSRFSLRFRRITGARPRQFARTKTPES